MTFKAILRSRFLWGLVTGMVACPVLIVAILLAYSRLFMTPVEERIRIPFLPGTSEADYDWTLEDLDGQPFELAQLRGQTVFLTVFRATCGSCRAEMPYLQELYEKTREDGIAFAIIAIEKDDAIFDLIAEHALTFPIYTYEGKRPEVYKSRGIPATFILSPDGKIAHRYEGAARWDDDACLAFLRSLADDAK